MFKTKKPALALTAITVAATMLLGGCQTKEEKEAAYRAAHINDPVSVDQMENGRIYILREDGSCQPLYWGTASFDQYDLDGPRDDRFFYMRDEETDKIPTLNGATEKLVMKTTSAFGEYFTYERFEDMGYSIGLLNPYSRDSGRIAISIDPDDNTTLPGTDTRALLNLYQKDSLENVTIDTLGGKQLKAVDTDGNAITLLNRLGAFKGLEPNTKYETKIYAGSIMYKYIFVSDLHFFDSMDETTTLNYTYNDENNYIEISIPKSFHVGYYTVNGQGLMRYVPSGYNLTADTDYNVPNDNSKEINAFTYTMDNSDQYALYQATGQFVDTGGTQVAQNSSDMTADQYIERYFSVQQRGYYKVTIAVSNARSTDPDLSIILVTPAGEKYQLQQSKDDPNIYSVKYYAHIAGKQCIRYYGAGMRAAAVSVTVAEPDPVD